MAHSTRILFRTTQKRLIALFALALPMTALAAHHEQTITQDENEAQTETETKGRGMAMELEAEVTAIDRETREVTLKGPSGDSVTIVAKEDVVKLEDVSVGDHVVVTYLAALEGELRTPTAEELAEPWVELNESSVSDDSSHPGVADARVIRAVVTIEGMNRELGMVTVKDSRGKLHIIGDVEAAKMEGVKLGQTAVLVFAEAVALKLEKKQPASE